MALFEIDIPALSRGLLDRSEDVRDPERVVASWATARVLVVGAHGRIPLNSDGSGVHLSLVGAPRWGGAPPAGAVLLGSLAGTHYWAVPAPDGEPEPAAASSGTVRSVGAMLADDEAALATTAVALLGWHAGAGFCSRCGRPTAPDATGHSRSCSAGHQEFPRTDPAVIVLVHDGAGSAVLARQPSWAPGRFSVLAGFAEAGESLEATVTREMGEEIGVRVDDVQYLGSQPWPFPRSLMIAFAARAPAGAVLRPRHGEIEQARWVSRDRLRELLAAGGVSGGDRGVDGGVDRDGDGVVSLPDTVSIARRMVEGFVAAG